MRSFASVSVPILLSRYICCDIYGSSRERHSTVSGSLLHFGANMRSLASVCVPTLLSGKEKWCLARKYIQ